ncbi:hypothetical protein J6590_042210 [Homalodisca vitripennis]|nr:hypothetical protein J6590_042210 [Homalodisca vitripennis]
MRLITSLKIHQFLGATKFSCCLHCWRTDKPTDRRSYLDLESATILATKLSLTFEDQLVEPFITPLVFSIVAGQFWGFFKTSDVRAGQFLILTLHGSAKEVATLKVAIHNRSLDLIDPALLC